MKHRQIEDHYDSPMALLDGEAEVKLVMADGDRSPLAIANVVHVDWAPYGMDERALWFSLEDGRQFAIVWDWTRAVQL